MFMIPDSKACAKMFGEEPDSDTEEGESEISRVQMHDNKYLRITMPDDSKWEVPLTVIAKNKGENHDYEGIDSIEECVHIAMNESDESLIDWAENSMNWDDVSYEAHMVGPGRTDYEEGWVNGPKEVIDYD